MSLGSNVRIVTGVTDGGASSDLVSIAVYRGSTLPFASGWDGGPVKRTLTEGGIVVH